MTNDKVMTIYQLRNSASQLESEALAANDHEIDSLWLSLEELYRIATKTLGNRAILSLEGEARTKQSIATLAKGVILACDLVEAPDPSEVPGDYA